jgi:hypothetical protein
MNVARWWADDDGKALGVSRSIIAEIETAARTGGSYLRYLFMNDANAQKDVLAHYGEANMGKLKALQAKYDEQRIFQKLVPGSFKLG